MTFGSLFSGVGGIDLGLERAGMRCAWQCELDPYARRVLARHWPNVRRHDDVRTFPPDVADAVEPGCETLGSCYEWSGSSNETQLRSAWHVDLIAGGFPCQDISYAGKGAGLSGERSGLWYEFARVVRVLRPRYVLVENVSALLTRGLDAVLGTLASLGYDAEWSCIPAAAVGAPHIRDRVFIVADAQRTERWSGGPDGCRMVDASDGLQAGWEENPGWSGIGGQEVRPLPLPILDGLEGLILGGPVARATLRSHRARCESGQWGRDPACDPESGVGRVVAGLPHRVDRLRGLGNAVVPQVAEWIGRQIMEHANGSDA
jgi:DNA (cytosine-5)-methyltransferase 1